VANVILSTTLITEHEVNTMSITIRATFDGTVLRPEQPVDLERDATYVVTIENPPTSRQQPRVNALTAIREMATDMGVDDLSINHDFYAHGKIRDQDCGI
jgi:hypothetical protein